MQIDKYVEDKQQLDENTKKFYYDKVKDNLEAIKKADEKAKEIINNIIEKGNLVKSDIEYYIIENSTEIRIMRIPQIHDALVQLQGNLKNPNMRLEILNYLDVLDAPFRELSKDDIWTNKKQLKSILAIIDIHLEEIRKYITMLKAELMEISKFKNKFNILSEPIFIKIIIHYYDCFLSIS